MQLLVEVDPRTMPQKEIKVRLLFMVVLGLWILQLNSRLGNAAGASKIGMLLKQAGKSKVAHAAHTGAKLVTKR